MTETPSTPPNTNPEAPKAAEDSTLPRTPAEMPAGEPAPAVLRPRERLVVPQPREASADRTEIYLRGPTAYCA